MFYQMYRRYEAKPSIFSSDKTKPSIFSSDKTRTANVLNCFKNDRSSKLIGEV